MKIQSRQEWINQGRNQKKQYVFYKDLCLNMSHFKFIHPGGSQVIRNYLFKDITDILFTVFPHNKQRVDNILEKYIVGKLNQPIVQRIKLEGTILKYGRHLKENQSMKKSVKFPSQIHKLASEKQKLQESKRKSKKKKSYKNNYHTNMSLNKSKKSNQKCLNPSYVQILKPQQKAKQITLTNLQGKQEIEVTIKQIDSSQSIVMDDLTESTLNISIKDQLLDDNGLSQLHQQQMLDLCSYEEPLYTIRVPVMTLKFDRIW